MTNEITKQIIINSFIYAFSKFVELDYAAIKNNTHEQCMSGRLGMYLREYFIDLEKDNIRVDVEYNRDKGNPKCENQSLPYSNKSNPYIRPDVLIHERDTDNNILYCEIKKNNGTDAEKVRRQVNGERRYKFGIYIDRINTNNITLNLLEKSNENFEKYVFDCNSKHLTLEQTNE